MLYHYIYRTIGVLQPKTITNYNNIINQLDDITSSEEREVLIETLFDDPNLDTTGELEEIKEGFDAELNEKRLDLEEALANMQELFANGSFSDDALVTWEDLVERLDQAIENLDEAGGVFDDIYSERASTIYDGSNGAQVNVDINPDGESEITHYINLEGNNVSMGNIDSETNPYDDGIKNYNDQKTSDPNALLLKQVIALNFNDSLVTVTSWDKATGRLVLRAENSRGIEYVEIKGFDPSRHVIAVSGTFINESNGEQWKEMEVGKYIYRANNEDGLNVWDELNWAEASLDERLEFAGNYSDIIDSSNISSLYDSYSNNLTPGGLSKAQFESIIQDVSHILYQMIDDPTKMEDPDLLSEALKVITDSALNSSEQAEAVALAILHFIKTDKEASAIFLAGDFLNQVSNLLIKETTPLGMAILLMLDDKYAMGSLGAENELFTAYTEDGEIDEEGNVTPITDEAAIRDVLTLAQEIYTHLGWGENNSFEEGIEASETREADNIAAEQEAGQESLFPAAEFTSLTGAIEAEAEDLSNGMRALGFNATTKADILDLKTLVEDLNNCSNILEMESVITAYFNDIQSSDNSDDMASVFVLFVEQYAPTLAETLFSDPNINRYLKNTIFDGGANAFATTDYYAGAAALQTILSSTGISTGIMASVAENNLSEKASDVILESYTK